MVNYKKKYSLGKHRIYPGSKAVLELDSVEWSKIVTLSKKISIYLSDKKYTKQYHSNIGFKLGEIYRLINNTIFSAACDLYHEQYPSQVAIIGFEFDEEENTVYATLIKK